VPRITGLLPQIGPLELAIILVIVILILGPKRIPAAFRGLKQGIRGFRDTLGSGDKDPDDPPVVAEKSHPREKSKIES
jgi:sec-independent protein translocase protein TatA